MAELIVVTGPPGAGKTTVSRALSATFERSALVAGDQFFAFIDRGHLAPWLPAAQHQNEVVTAAAAAAAGRLAGGGYPVVYDGVIGPWLVDVFGRAAGLARLHYALLLPPEDVCVHRVASRTGHGFTDLDAARHMYAEFARATIDSRHVVTCAGDPAALARHLRQLMADGSLLLPVQRHPAGDQVSDPAAG